MKTRKSPIGYYAWQPATSAGALAYVSFICVMWRVLDGITNVCIASELELNLRIKPRKRLKREKPEPLAVPERSNDTWSVDFMADQLTNGRFFEPLMCWMTSTVKDWESKWIYRFHQNGLPALWIGLLNGAANQGRFAVIMGRKISAACLIIGQKIGVFSLITSSQESHNRMFT